MKGRDDSLVQPPQDVRLDQESFFYRGTVLMVENDRVLRDLISLSLGRMGFLVKSVDEPTMILSAIENYKPQVVLLDLFLPGYSSLDLLQEIKESGWLDHARVIVISAFGFMEVLQQAIILGAMDFVIKPFDMDILAKKVVYSLTAL